MRIDYIKEIESSYRKYGNLRKYIVAGHSILHNLCKISDLYQIIIKFRLVRSSTLKRIGHSYGIRDAEIRRILIRKFFERSSILRRGEISEH